MFTHAPSVDRKEATYLIKDIMSAIKKISSSRQILAVVSWNQYQSSYNHVLLSRLDKYIEITYYVTSRRKRLSSLLSQSSVKLKTGNNKAVKCNYNANNNNNCNYLLPIRDLCFIQQR